MHFSSFTLTSLLLGTRLYLILSDNSSSSTSPPVVSSVVAVDDIAGVAARGVESNIEARTHDRKDIPFVPRAHVPVLKMVRARNGDRLDKRTAGAPVIAERGVDSLEKRQSITQINTVITQLQTQTTTIR